MIFGHLPAGYLVAKLLFLRNESRGVALKSYLLAGMFGATAPDLDMFYFYFVDHRQHHHHTYWTHYPVVWIVLLLVSVSLRRFTRTGKFAAYATIFSLNGLIHMLLDTFAGDVWWFAPFLNRSFSLYVVHPLYQPWWLNFILHWSFALEMAMIVGALYCWRRGAAFRYGGAVN